MYRNGAYIYVQVHLQRMYRNIMYRHMQRSGTVQAADGSPCTTNKSPKQIPILPALSDASQKRHQKKSGVESQVEGRKWTWKVTAWSLGVPLCYSAACPMHCSRETVCNSGNHGIVNLRCSELLLLLEDGVEITQETKELDSCHISRPLQVEISSEQ